MNKLYYGNNLDVLRESVATESVDLIYLDPPFNSKRDYNLLFKSPKVVAGGEGAYSAAQIEAFEDTWHWTQDVTEAEYDQVIRGPNSDVSEMMKALVKFSERNDMTAYLVMMANRLLQLHRVLKPSGSLYLHCDPFYKPFLKSIMKTCYMCDAPAAPGRGEHVPPRCLFPKHKDDGKLLIRVPSCVTHNVEKSKHDQLLCHYLTIVGGNNELATEVFNDVVWPVLTDPDRPYTAKTFLHNLREVQLPTERGGAFTLDLERFEEGIGCITRGLFFAETRRKLRVPLDVMWSALRFPSSLEAPFRDVIEKWEGLLPPTFRGNQPRVFQYAFHYFRGIGNWLCRMRFYEGPTLYVHWIPTEVTEFADVVARHPFAIRGRADQLVEECKREIQKEIEIAIALAQENFEKFAALIVSFLKAHPNYRKKKGINTHIDGIRYFRDLDRKEVHTMLLSVKGGENVGQSMVKDLIATLARDGADIGLFITLAAPTRAMITEAAAAGFYGSPNGKKYPRLQLLTVAGLLDGTQRALHPDYEPDLGYKKARAEDAGEQTTLL